MRYIGDIHGDFGAYLAITDGCERSVQVGDFGWGFGTVPEIPFGHDAIRGNHDDPALARVHPNYIGDYAVRGSTFFLSGAWSFDRAKRYVGVDWWEDEELSYGELEQAISLYEDTKPLTMVSHECPFSFATEVFDIEHGSRTAHALEVMLSIHRPKIWIFGHYHTSMNIVTDGTRFICLGINSFVDLPD